MAETHQNQHTILPRAHLKDYFGGPRFEMFDIAEEQWISTGPSRFGVWKDYNDDEYEKMLAEVESAAIPLVRKLIAGAKLDDTERIPVAQYIVETLFRSPIAKNEALSEVAQEMKEDFATISTTRQHEDSARHLESIIDDLTTDQDYLWKVRRESTENSIIHAQLPKRISNLTWTIVQPQNPRDFFLLPDYPVLYGNLDDDATVWITFPITTHMSLHIHRETRNRWTERSFTRPHMKDANRRLVRMAQRFIATPKRVNWLPKLIRNMKANTRPTYGYDGFVLEPRSEWRKRVLKMQNLDGG